MTSRQMNVKLSEIIRDNDDYPLVINYLTYNLDDNYDEQQKLMMVIQSLQKNDNNNNNNDPNHERLPILWLEQFHHVVQLCTINLQHIRGLSYLILDYCYYIDVQQLIHYQLSKQFLLWDIPCSLILEYYSGVNIMNNETEYILIKPKSKVWKSKQKYLYLKQIPWWSRFTKVKCINNRTFSNHYFRQSNSTFSNNYQAYYNRVIILNVSNSYNDIVSYVHNARHFTLASHVIIINDLAINNYPKAPFYESAFDLVIVSPAISGKTVEIYGNIELEIKEWSRENQDLCTFFVVQLHYHNGLLFHTWKLV